jgi:hypothetical protein
MEYTKEILDLANNVTFAWKEASGEHKERLHTPALLIHQYVQSALAEREAQVRAEDREKVAGLVEALHHIAEPTENTYGNPQFIARCALASYRANEKDPATYNDNRKG